MATVTTTVKVDICSFSEYRMYPGRGTKFASRDGKVYFFLNSKTSSLGHKKIKPIKLRWTQSWRRANKKIQSSTVQRRRARRTARFQKAIVGLTLEELKSRRLVTSNVPDRAIRDAKLKARKGKQVVAPVVTAPVIQSKDKKQVPQQAKPVKAVVEVQSKKEVPAKVVEQSKKVEQPPKKVEQPPKKVEQAPKVPEQPKQVAESKKQERVVEEPPKPKVEKPKVQEQKAPEPQKAPVPQKAPEPQKEEEQKPKEEAKKSSFIGKLFGRMR